MKPFQSFSGNFAPVPDNSDMQSSISFNTSFLMDQFDNMDSISQIGGNTDQDSNSNVEVSKRDKKINDLLSDRMKLKGLLKKAKTAIDSINVKYKDSLDNQK